MSPESVLSKTAKGSREIETRENRLDSRLRALLIVVNGKSTAGEIAKKFAQLGDVSGLLETLVREGYAAASAPVSATALKDIQAQLCRALSDALGPGADVLTEKIESLPSVDALRTYLAGQRELLTGALGKARAAAFWAKADRLLG